MDKKFLEYHFRDNKLIELRHQNDRVWTTTYHTDIDSLEKQYNSVSHFGNSFISLNRPKGIPTGPLKNKDVDLHTRLLFDFDPERPTGHSSNSEELAKAAELTKQVGQALLAQGWSMPARALSGNGYHLVFRTFMQNNDETKQILKALYQGMNREYSNEFVSFDTTVRNPARIFALYGSIKRKGVNSPERPHRRSEVITPVDWKQVTPKQVESLANYYQKQVTSHFKPRTHTNTRISGKGDYKSLDAVSMFQAHGLYLQEVESGKHYVTCPWSVEHSSTGSKDTVIWESAGDSWPTFHCSHAHCDGRTMQDVIQIFGDADSFCSQEFKGGASHEA